MCLLCSLKAVVNGQKPVFIEKRFTDFHSVSSQWHQALLLARLVCLLYESGMQSFQEILKKVQHIYLSFIMQFWFCCCIVFCVVAYRFRRFRALTGLVHHNPSETIAPDDWQLLSGYLNASDKEFTSEFYALQSRKQYLLFLLGIFFSMLLS